jgi:hypothetical protein
MLSGLIPAVLFPLLFPNILELYLFPILLVITALGCIIGTYTAPPTDEDDLIEFYKRTRPWGFWKPVHDKLMAREPGFRIKKTLGRDAMNIFTGTACQTLLVLIPLYLILREYLSLKLKWWDTLEDQN